MAVPVKKTTKPAQAASNEHNENPEEEYELLPHKDIVELREELRKLKSLPSEAGSHAEASYEDLTKKMDRLIEIFENAEKSLKIEEGAMSFKEKMAPFTEKLNKALEQNSEIAEGIVALADLMSEIKDKLEVGVIYKAKEAEKFERRMPEPEEEKEQEEFMPGPMPEKHQGQMMGTGGMGIPPSRPQMPPQAQGAGMFPPRPQMPIPGQGAGMPPPLPRMGAPMPQQGMPGPMPGPMPPPPPGGMPMPPPLPGEAQPKKKGIFGK